MTIKSMFPAALVTSSLLLAGVANAATLVTINTAGNAVDTSATATTFQATGATGAINSVFTIGATIGTGVAWTEVGDFQVTSFGDGNTSVSNPLGTVVSNVLTGYNVFADISFSGLGDWGGAFGNIFSAGPASTFNLTLRAVNLITTNTIALGTATLIPSLGNSATVTLVSGTSANTSISGEFKFNPAPGTTGLGNFFEAPDPFNINFSVGNFGGNPANTTYTVSALGVMTVFTPGAGLPAATGNLTFVGQVPEPGALALVGLALAGLGLSSRRKSAKV